LACISLPSVPRRDRVVASANSVDMTALIVSLRTENEAVTDAHSGG
jgi:hypothetical protein